MPRRPHGFTFIEITLVILIIGILSAVTLPRLRGSAERMELHRGAREVTALLRLARDTAALRETPVEVRFSPNTDEYQLVVFNEMGERLETRNHRRRFSRARQQMRFPGEEAMQVKRLPGDGDVFFSVVMTDAPLTEDTELPRVIFYPDGTATPATIGMENDNKSRLSIEIFRATGLARIGEGLPVEEERERTLYYGPER